MARSRGESGLPGLGLPVFVRQEASSLKLYGTAVILPNGHLTIGGCDSAGLARRFGTPLWVIDERLFRERCRAFREAFSRELFPGGAEVAYASKALLTLAVARIVEEEGLSLDVVSGGELYTARAAGFPMDKVYFHGSNKSAAEIAEALEAGVGRFMVDNLYELELLDGLAAQGVPSAAAGGRRSGAASATGSPGRRADVTLRLTPDVEAPTHDYTRTGQVGSKFGLAIRTGQAFEAVGRALASDHLRLRGYHCHIGSQILEVEPFARAARVLVEFAAEVRDKTGYVPEEIDLGGGFGIGYAENDTPHRPADYALAISRVMRETVAASDLPPPKVVVEPGRAISGPAGWTLYTVGSVKRIPGVRTYVAVDGGIGDNPRPALYQARHEACLANRAAEAAVETVTIAGRYCESGDILIHDIALPDPRPGDVLAVSSTGAYNYAMSMNYNRLPRPAIVLVAGGRADVIVERESYGDIVAHDRLPARLARRAEMGAAGGAASRATGGAATAAGGGPTAGSGVPRGGRVK